MAERHLSILAARADQAGDSNDDLCGRYCLWRNGTAFLSAARSVHVSDGDLHRASTRRLTVNKRLKSINGGHWGSDIADNL